jgi:hypothetical protein
MIHPDFCIPLIEGVIWAVGGTVYFEDKKGRQKKLGKIDKEDVQDDS